jgi:uncharacterized protein YcbK (DUF882 family)
MRRIPQHLLALLVSTAGLGVAATAAQAWGPSASSSGKVGAVVSAPKSPSSNGDAKSGKTSSTPTPSAKAAASVAPSAKPVSSTTTATSAKPVASTSAKPTIVSAKPPAKPPAGKPKPTAKKGFGNYAPPAYVAMIKQWHLATDGKAPVDEKGRPKLVLVSINRGERVELVASTDKGDFSPTELDKASKILRAGDDHEHPVDPRLLDMVYELQKHFKTGEVRFVSGYRTPLKRLGSNHGYGRAMDLVIPGTIDEWVASYVRAMGFTGAGTYPTSGFVHVDVRERSFYWIDKSGPGAPNKTTGVLQGDAIANDAKARKDGKIGPGSPTIGRDVDAALAARVKAVTTAATTNAPIAPDGPDMDVEDDDDDGQ